MRLRLVGSPWDGLTDGQIFVRPNSPPRLSLCDHLSDLIGQKNRFSAIFLAFCTGVFGVSPRRQKWGLGEEENAFVVHGNLESGGGRGRGANFNWTKFSGSETF